MKKTLLAVALATMGLAQTVSATALPPGTASFQWSGSVPPATVSGAGYWIVQEGAVGMLDGLMTFSNDNGEIRLNSASEIGFKVVKDVTDASTPAANGIFSEEFDIEPMGYKAVLTSVRVGVGGVSQEQTPTNDYFQVHVDGAAVAIDDEIDRLTGAAKGLPTRLNIQPKDAGASSLESGSEVGLQVVMTITPDSV